ncbi:hypothetical protein BDW74DRAFT_69164 [Aspergillus multicolor]|uniref:uncharacterized protein n=1 Tax=Aspergillus multicolor TaxID=41759 RepID=UPI003CCCEE6A
MARNMPARKPSHGSDDVYTSDVDEEVERDLPAYPYAYEYEYEDENAPARTNSAQGRRQTTHTTQYNSNRTQDHKGVMTENAGIRTTSNSSPIRTVNSNPDVNPKNNFTRNRTRDANSDSNSQAMQTYSACQVSTTRNGAGEIQSQHEVSNTEQFGQDQQLFNNDGLKLRLNLNLDVEVELKARIHGDLTVALFNSLRSWLCRHPAFVYIIKLHILYLLLCILNCNYRLGCDSLS